MYITDASSEGRSDIMIVDLGIGESWRHLDQAISTGRAAKISSSHSYGEPRYMVLLVRFPFHTLLLQRMACLFPRTARLYISGLLCPAGSITCQPPSSAIEV